jgi:chromate transporter
MSEMNIRSRSSDRKLLIDLFFSFAKISLFTVGGGLAMIPLVMDLATQKRGWLSSEEMMDCLAISQSLPGGIIINMASYIGRRLLGTKGMIAAAFGVVAPTAVLVVLIGIFLANFGENIYAAGAVQGAKAAAVGLVLATFIKLGKTTFNKPVFWVIAIAVIFLIVVLHVFAIWLIIAGGAIGWIVYMTGRKKEAG